MSEYKRFTKRDVFGNADIIGVDSMRLQGSLSYKELRISTKALNRLAELEDKIESGELRPARETAVATAKDIVYTLKARVSLWKAVAEQDIEQRKESLSAYSKFEPYGRKKECEEFIDLCNQGLIAYGVEVNK